MNKVKIGNTELTAEDVEELYYCISHRMGFIETGTIHRASDLKNANSNFRPNVLSTHQMKLLIRLEEIMTMMVE
jgi:hypothetical protein